MTNKIEVQWIAEFEESNLLVGNKLINGKFFSHVVTNLEKRIQDGTYPLEYELAETPLTLLYRGRKWAKEIDFKHHIEIKNVFNEDGSPRDGLYFHPFNYSKESDGCVAHAKFYTDRMGMTSRGLYITFYDYFRKEVKQGNCFEITFKTIY